MEIAQQFFTPAQFARILNISPGSVYRYLKSGRIKGTKIAGSEKGKWRIHEDEIGRIKGA